jgi:hypothetical protein
VVVRRNAAKTQRIQTIVLVPLHAAMLHLDLLPTHLPPDLGLTNLQWKREVSSLFAESRGGGIGSERNESGARRRRDESTTTMDF